MTHNDRQPCLHPQVHHEHGSRLAYALDRCRCRPCCLANSDYEAARARAKAYGRPTTTWVDAGPVREHVERLRAAGLGWKTIAATADVHASAVSRLIYGRKREAGHREAPAKRIRGEVARALLAVPLPTTDDLPGGVKVDGTGTRRRLQALVAVGWPLRQLADRLGMEPGNISRVVQADVVMAATHRAVVGLYDDLWDQQPAAGPGPTRARARAAAEGWPPPAAWDDDAIDDPTAAPSTGSVDPGEVDQLAVEAVRDGHSMRLTGATLHAAVREMVAAGYPVDTIAARTGADERQVHRLRARPTPPRAKAPTTTRRAA